MFGVEGHVGGGHRAELRGERQRVRGDLKGGADVGGDRSDVLGGGGRRQVTAIDHQCGMTAVVAGRAEHEELARQAVGTTQVGGLHPEWLPARCVNVEATVAGGDAAPDWLNFGNGVGRDGCA